MLRRFAPVSSSSSSSKITKFVGYQSSSLCVGRYSSTTTEATTTTTTTSTESPTEKKKFDPVAWAKEQERRRQTEARKSFWTPSGTTNMQAEIDQLEKQKEALVHQQQQQKRKLEEDIESQQQRPIWGRDTIELVERVQQQQEQNQSPLHSGFSARSKNKTAAAATKEKELPEKKGGLFPNGLAGGFSGKNPLTQRLDSLYKTYAGKDTKTKEAQDAILAKRKEQLRWREIDYQLDQVKLERDLIQWVNYLKMGTDYAIDCELERELRYFPEHVAAELKKNLKFLAGSSRLIKTGPVFPTMQKVTCLSTILDKVTKSGEKTKLLKTYEEDMVSQGTFKMPTVVFISQLAHGSDVVEDIDRYYVPLVREAVSNPHHQIISNNNNNISSISNDPATRMMKNISSSNNNQKDNQQQQQQQQVAEVKSPQKCTPRDVSNIVTEVTQDVKFQGKFEFMYLKTADFQSSIWLRKWLTKVHATRINAVLAPRTYVGTRLLRNFSASLGLRNYGAQYVLLVDHQGKIRWLSTGPPTAQEVEWFLDHCRNLMKLHTIAKAK